MDALSETLRVVRLVGAIFIKARFTAPWCYQSPRADSAAPLLEPGAERVVIFHLITEGECYVELGDERAGAPDRRRCRRVSARRRAPHDVAARPAARQAARASTTCWRAGRARSPTAAAARRRAWSAATSPATRASRSMLLAGLPPLVRVNVRGSNAGVWLEASVRYALAEARSPRPGGAGVLAKLAEVLFIEVLRLYMNEQSDGPHRLARRASAIASSAPR